MFESAEITSDILPYITAQDLLDIGIPTSRVDEIAKNLENFRPSDLMTMNEKEKENFEQFSAFMTETDAHSVRANCIQHVRYLTAVVRKINDQVIGLNQNSRFQSKGTDTGTNTIFQF